MNTRTGSADAPTSIDGEALDAAMKAHPVVLDAIERMAATRRRIEGERDQAVKDLAAEKADHRKTKAKLEATAELAEKFMKSIGTVPATLPAAPPAMSDAEALAKFDAMTPHDKALVLLKGTKARHFDIRGKAPAMENVFGH